MKKLVLMLCLVSLSLGGCSGLIANKEMSKVIDANAALGTQQLTRIMAQPYTAEQATPLIAANTLAFTQYRNAATMNPLAFLFGGKSILVNAAYWKEINTKSALSDTIPTWSDQFTPEDYNHVLQWQAGSLVWFKNAKDGIK
jgi:hypothetical protein